MAGESHAVNYGALQEMLPLSPREERERKLCENYRGFLSEYVEELRSDPEHYSPILENAESFVRSLRVKIGNSPK